MKRPSYKKIYIEEKLKSETLDNCLNNILKWLKQFEDLEIIDEIVEPCIRTISIARKDNYISMAIYGSQIPKDKLTKGMKQ